MYLKRILATAIVTFFAVGAARAQYNPDAIISVDSTATILSLEDALKIALSENVSVKVADKEIERLKYAKAGTYAALFPQINASASYQRTIKKQVMYMGGSGNSGGGMASMVSGLTEPIMHYINQLVALHPGQVQPYIPPEAEETESSGNDGFEVGRLNTWSAGINAAMPLVNAQLWSSLKISGQQVELAVEKARESRLSMVAEVKQAYYAVLLAKEALNVFERVYENALLNAEKTERRHNVQKASDLDLVRSKTALANAIPDVYNAASSIALALWQLKAVIGMDLDEDIDVEGKLDDYADGMFRDITEGGEADLSGNSSLRQLELQADMLAETVKMQTWAYMPSLALNFAYSFNSMNDDFKFSEYKWTPYSYVGLSLSIPIFSGGKRFNDVRQAKVQAAELDYQRVNVERQLKIAVRQCLKTMETAMKTRIAAEDALSSAEKAYGIAEKSFEVGRATLTDLNDAQLALTQANLAVCQSVYNFIVAKTSLEQTLGRDFLADDGSVDLDGSYR